jgi:hypothetical protein
LPTARVVSALSFDGGRVREERGRVLAMAVTRSPPKSFNPRRRGVLADGDVLNATLQVKCLIYVEELNER